MDNNTHLIVGEISPDVPDRILPVRFLGTADCFPVSVAGGPESGLVHVLLTGATSSPLAG